jgi:hypothetical protein
MSVEGINQLKQSLENLSQVSSLFQTHASECESIYQSKDEIRKLVSSKNASQSIQESQKRCVDTVKVLKTNLNDVSNLLLNLWMNQEKELEQQSSRIHKYAYVNISLGIPKLSVES